MAHSATGGVTKRWRTVQLSVGRPAGRPCARVVSVHKKCDYSAREGISTMKKPKKSTRRKFKQKFAIRNVDFAVLNDVARRAVYEPSRYHCAEEGKGRALRGKPASKCPRSWKPSEAQRALRSSIRAGHVSERANGEFPRTVWYRDGTDIYEAVSEPGTPERYHAYPIEEYELPKSFRW